MVFFLLAPPFNLLPWLKALTSATSNLLCSETHNTCFDEDLECNGAVDGSGISTSWDHMNLNLDNMDNVGSESFVCFVAQNEEIMRVMVEKEIEHLPREDYLMRWRSGDLEVSVRREALDWIWKAHAYYGFGPLSLCLSVNYLDRFLSAYQLPRVRPPAPFGPRSKIEYRVNAEVVIRSFDFPEENINCILDLSTMLSSKATVDDCLVTSHLQIPLYQLPNQGSLLSNIADAFC
ncbi:hypothetical protein KIW84_065760 [Lathyrus oleraceus]|uniref:B-like cyclin n=1 Tax=Pisum sativum TaxID=3888 RepID=A0A9D4WI33_PEA|nr:hypothetical protein KIW84_065760 [Pisum sativum]